MKQNKKNPQESEGGGPTNSRVEGQNRGIWGEIKDVGKSTCKGRTQGMDKLETDANSQSHVTWKGRVDPQQDCDLSVVWSVCFT